MPVGQWPIQLATRTIIISSMRLPPPEPSSLDTEVADLVSLAVAPSGEPAETIAVLAHSPALVGPFLSWAMALHSHGVLSKRVHEIIALRVAHLCGSTYEWDEHVRWAAEAGIRESEVVVTTTMFEPVARTLSANFGLAECRRLVLPHPLGGTDEATLHAWADAAIDELIQQFTTRR